MRSGPTLSERCVNRWEDILRAVGLPDQIFSRKAQACIFCGGKDRFIWDNKGGNGTFLCRQCGSGDGIELVKKWCTVEFKEAAEIIEKHIGSARARVPTLPPDHEKQRQAMAALWRRGTALMGGDIASRYLKNRGISMTVWPSALRFVNDLAYFEGKTVKGYYPAMIANYRAPDNQTGILHRTFLTEPGVKADVEKVKMFMPGRVPPGGAVRLGPVAEVMGIAEGIETALAASLLHSIPVWATLSAGNLTKWEPPKGVKTVIVFADLDDSFTGQTAAYQLATKLRCCYWADDAKTKRLDIEVRSTLFSDNGHMNDDWDDVLQNEMRAAAGVQAAG